MNNPAGELPGVNTVEAADLIRAEDMDGLNFNGYAGDDVAADFADRLGGGGIDFTFFQAAQGVE